MPKVRQCEVSQVVYYCYRELNSVVPPCIVVVSSGSQTYGTPVGVPYMAMLSRSWHQRRKAGRFAEWQQQQGVCKPVNRRHRTTEDVGQSAQQVSCEDIWMIPRRRSFVHGRDIIQCVVSAVEEHVVFLLSPVVLSDEVLVRIVFLKQSTLTPLKIYMNMSKTAPSSVKNLDRTLDTSEDLARTSQTEQNEALEYSFHTSPELHPTHELLDPTVSETSPHIYKEVHTTPCTDSYFTPRSGSDENVAEFLEDFQAASETSGALRNTQLGTLLTWPDIVAKLKGYFTPTETMEKYKQLLYTKRQQICETCQTHIETMLYYRCKYNPQVEIAKLKEEIANLSIRTQNPPPQTYDENHTQQSRQRGINPYHQNNYLQRQNTMNHIGIFDPHIETRREEVGGDCKHTTTSTRTLRQYRTHVRFHTEAEEIMCGAVTHPMLPVHRLDRNIGRNSPVKREVESEAQRIAMSRHPPLRAHTRITEMQSEVPVMPRGDQFIGPRSEEQNMCALCLYVGHKTRDCTLFPIQKFDYCTDHGMIQQVMLGGHKDGNDGMHSQNVLSHTLSQMPGQQHSRQGARLDCQQAFRVSSCKHPSDEFFLSFDWSLIQQVWGEDSRTSTPCNGSTGANTSISEFVVQLFSNMTNRQQTEDDTGKLFTYRNKNKHDEEIRTKKFFQSRQNLTFRELLYVPISRQRHAGSKNTSAFFRSQTLGQHWANEKLLPGLLQRARPSKIIPTTPAQMSTAVVCWWKRTKLILNQMRGRSGVFVRLLASQNGEPGSIPGRIAPGYFAQPPKFLQFTQPDEDSHSVGVLAPFADEINAFLFVRRPPNSHLINIATISCAARRELVDGAFITCSKTFSSISDVLTVRRRLASVLQAECFTALYVARYSKWHNYTATLSESFVHTGWDTECQDLPFLDRAPGKTIDKFCVVSQNRLCTLMGLLHVFLNLNVEGGGETACLLNFRVPTASGLHSVFAITPLKNMEMGKAYYVQHLIDDDTAWSQVMTPSKKELTWCRILFPLIWAQEVGTIEKRLLESYAKRKRLIAHLMAAAKGESS
ncbi:hypothetical protein PR048_005544 [Dryococelus australis]|uniref:Uncharacterized protein n=1 Tax=Dryococelus australis TaxID=614101 RepID=A0ABQ9I8H0_9NEOP|nr:hypothetical protein PR048_005544 [Dryococelus australis]